MYKSNKLLKAKNAIYKAVFSFFLLLNTSLSYSQTWKYNITEDYEFSIQDVWAEMGIYVAKFVVSNQKTAFVKEIVISDDNIGKLVFPDEFKQTRGKFNKDTISNFSWYIEVKKQRVASGKIEYNPSPNTVIQLQKYDVINFSNKKVIWGDVIDGFSWEDKKGENIFIRSKRVSNNTVHLYFYHFIKKEGIYQLSRKLTDFVKNCDLDISADNIIESIELTDINKDTIAEISFIYTVDCNCIEDSLPKATKLMLFTAGEKYAIRRAEASKKEEEIPVYEIGENLMKKDLYRRFLVKKWKKQVSE